jgi:predicted secreted protein
LSLTHSPRVTTNFDSGGWETRAKGKKEWEISGNSLFAFDADYGFAELYALYEAGTQVKLKWKTENGDFSDNDVYSGYAYISQLSATGSTEENETVSFSFSGDGKIELSFYPLTAFTSADGDFIFLTFHYPIDEDTGNFDKFEATCMDDGSPLAITFYDYVNLPGSSEKTMKLYVEDPADPGNQGTIPFGVTDIKITYTRDADPEITTSDGLFFLEGFEDFPVTNNITQP